MKKTVLTFGLISGLIMAATFVATIPFHDNIGFSSKALLVGYASMVAASLLIYFGIRSYRDNVAGGAVGFGRAFAVGMLIVAVSGTIYVATWEIVYPLYMPDFYDKYSAQILESARAKGATPAEMEVKLAETKKTIAMYKNPVINVLMTFLEPLPVGLIVTLISAWVLSRRRGAIAAVPAT